MRRQLVNWTNGIRIALLLLMAAVASCGDGDTAKKSGGASEPPDELSQWAIQVYVGDGANRKLVKFPPVKEISFGSATDAVLQAGASADGKASPAKRMGLPTAKPGKSVSKGDQKVSKSKAPSSKQKALIEGDDGGVNVEQDLSMPSGWALVYGAAAECGMVPEMGGIPDTFLLNEAVVPPWSALSGGGTAWSIFQRRPESCSEQLQQNEALLCIAAELNALSQAIAPVRWEKVADAAPLPGVPPGPWTLKPQANRDRFIFRDLAIYMLATLAVNDTWPIARFTETGDGSCSKVFVKAIDDYIGFAEPNSEWIFGEPAGEEAPYFPPKDPPERQIDSTTVPNLATNRLKFQTQILRSASRLLDELIDTSVEADLAGAAMRRAKATDPLRGAQIAWGDRNNDNGPYNTLAHALRVVMGRWELSPAVASVEWYTTDPKCGTVATEDLLEQAFGADRDARIEDIAIRTKGQELATQIVEKAGIVIPTSQLANTASVRAAVKAQLVGKEAAASGLLPADPQVAEIGLDRSVQFVLDDLSEADLNFALTRTFTQYRVLNTAPAVTSVVAPGGGLVPDTFVAPELGSVNGVALKDGIPRQDMEIDVMSRVAGIQNAIQCDEYFGANGLLNADWAVRTSFQDSYSLGQALARRLVVLRESVRASTGLAGEVMDELLDTSEKAAAEAQLWSGEGRIVATSDPSMSVGGIEEVVFYTLGFQPKDFAVSNVTDMAGQLILAYGEPWVADCAARLRNNCPANLNDYLLTTPSFTLNADLTDAERLYTGHDGTVGLWRFPTSGQFTPTYFPGESPTTLPTKFVYVILKNDPDSPAGKGKVLGSIALRQPDLINDDPTGGTNIVVSDKQRRHLNDIFGFNKIGNTHLGPESLSASPAYCIGGVLKNLFVPLENELTSDSDEYENSWRHYLSLARQAAERADSLGKELIELGLQKDFRREAAGENLAQICGDYAALDNVKVEKGQVSAKKPNKDQALEACLGEDKVPLVFITQNPLDFESDKEAFLHSKLGCGTSYASELCNSLSTLGPDDVVGLNLAEYVPAGAPTGASECDEVNNAVASLSTSFAGHNLQTFAAQPWISKTALTELTKRLKVRVDVDTSLTPYWALELSLTTIMNSTDTGAWPGCRRPGQTCPVEDDAKLYDRLFRRTPPGTQLGGGPDGNVDDELNAILWRVQGAVWNLGALSGSIEQGLFDVQLPASNFGPSGQRASLFTVYGPGFFVNFELPTGVPEEEREAVGTAAFIPPGMTWPQNAGIPTWLVELSAKYGTGPYLRIPAENRSRTGFGVPDIATWLSGALGNLHGISCGDPAGGTRQFGAAPGTATAAHFDAVGALTALRAGKDWGEICKSPTVGHDILALRWVSEDVYDSVFRDLVVNQRTDASVGTTPANWSVLPPFPQIEGTGAGQIDYQIVIGLPGQVTFPADTTDSGFLGYTYPQLACRHQKYGKFGIPSAAGSPGIHEVTQSCAVSNGQVLDVPYILGKPPSQQATPCNDPNECRTLAYQRTTLSLMPRSCPKENRVELFVNSYPPPFPCGAASQLAQTMALACNIGTGSVLGAVSGRPELTKLSDLEGFTRWVDQLSKDASRQASNIYLEGLPRRVVEAFNQKKVGGEAFKGDHGVKLLELRGSLEGLAGGWNRVSGNLAQLHEAIKSAQISIQGAKISQKQAMVAFAMQRLSIHASMLQSASGAIGGFSVGSLGGGTIAGLTNAGIGVATGAAQLEKVKEGEKLAAASEGNAVSAALNQLQLVSGPLYTDLQNALGDIRASASTVLAIVEQIRQNERKAKYEAAKGSGADYVEIDGQKVPFPVNTVQRRLYDATNLRYQQALKEAKYLSYVARLAIEQRLGVRLAGLTQPIGPIDAPAEWADDVCSLTGVDYTKLSTFVGPDGGTPTDAGEQAIIAEFADQYIGDYVTKLEGFVEYYNIEYPSHDGDDTTVLSLRDDLLGPPQACTVEAPNMLYYSSDLAGYDFIDVGGTPTTRGWELTPCDATGTTCLRVDRSSALAVPQTLPAAGTPPETAGNDFSWLHDFAAPGGVDAGADGGSGPEGGIPTIDLPRTVAQTVTLTAGASYVLSWWDQARAPDGTLLPAASTGVQYSVTVLAPDGSVAGSFTGAPFVPDPNPPDAGPAPSAWSERRAVGLTASQSGDYKVVFAAAAFPNELGSVLIASVQLEEAPPASLPGPYFDVKSTRLIASSNCGGLTKEDVQGAFRYACDTNNQCFYELVSPLVFDTGNLGVGDSRLTGLLAADNFNFRHITVAVNLVGTGVYDCSNNPTQSCFSKAYVDYTLNHDAFQVGVLSWTGPKDKQIFNFGSAAINHGKALAAERYITLPVGSADQALLSQAGVEKPEYRGRPLDGSYRFRVWDSPQLRWNRLEDIQLVLRYRYWSPIQPQAGQ